MCNAIPFKLALVFLVIYVLPPPAACLHRLKLYTTSRRPKLPAHLAANATNRPRKSGGNKSYLASDLDLLVIDKLFLKNLQNLQYYGFVEVGNQQKFKMLFDTASGWTWLAGDRCKTCNYRKKYSC